MRSEIRSLTGLRGLAACWVMMGHYLGHTPSNLLVRAFVTHMYVGVDMFMILSGFVLAMTYEDRLTPRAMKGEYLRFLQHRLARLFPLNALVTTVCLVMMAFGIGLNGSDTSLAGITANLLMMQAWWWPDNSINGTGWSLSIEWGENLLFPLFVMLLLHASSRRAALIAAMAAVCLVVFGLLQGQSSDAQAVTGALDFYKSPGSLIRCTTEFMAGMYCWRLRSRTAWTRNLSSTPVLLAMLAAIAVTTVMPSMDLVFVLLASALMIGFSFERSCVAAAFGTPVLRWLGTISFSIYLWHLPILAVRAALLKTATGVQVPDQFQVDNALHAAICFVLALGLATVSFYYFEKPMQRWMRRLFAARDGRRQALPVGAEPAAVPLG